jgi:hypothetical protein
LDQTIIIDNTNHVEIYNIWDKTFTVDGIAAILRKHGFDEIQFYGDITGKPYLSESDTICILAQKK